MSLISDTSFNSVSTLGEDPPFTNPYDGICHWKKEAENSEINDPEAMALATCDSDGMPDVRMVLLKEIRPDGLVFYTNSLSSKGKQLSDNPKAALLFHWKSLRRQIRVRGITTMLPAEDADEYFASRRLGSQLAAASSKQSQTIEKYSDLIVVYRNLELKFKNNPVKRPDYWRGYILKPDCFEFWHDGPYRMHRRWKYTRSANNASWQVNQLQP